MQAAAMCEQPMQNEMPAHAVCNNSNHRMIDAGGSSYASQAQLHRKKQPIAAGNAAMNMHSQHGERS
jgi:hypothetical protein